MMIDIVYNPYAGGEKNMIKNLAKAKQHLDARGVEYRLHKTEYAKHAVELTKNAVANGAVTIVAMGGDGTLNEVLNGLDNFENVTLGLIPCGTGNDFANHAGIPCNVEKAIDLIIDKPAAFVDYMQMPEVRALNVVGTGIDVEVLKLYAALKKKTRFGYMKCLLKALTRFKCIDFESEINGKRQTHCAFIAGVANASMFGGGLKMCPMADTFDGKLNFVYVTELKGFKMLNALLKLKSGKIDKVPEAHFVQVENIKLASKVYTTVQVDGELYENTPFEVDVIHEKLKMHLNTEYTAAKK